MVLVSQRPKFQGILIALAMTFCMPSVIKNIKFRLIKYPMSIQLQSSQPPKIAFQDALQRNKNQQIENEWKEIETKPAINLNTLHFERKNWNIEGETNSKRTSVSEMKFSVYEIKQSLDERNWIQDLPTTLQKRISIAQQKTSLLDEDWRPPSWEEQVRQIIQKDTRTNSGKQNIAHTNVRKDRVEVYRQNSDGSKTTRNDIEVASATFSNLEAPSAHRLTGTVRLYDGLALGDREIEVRRYEEGIPMEVGTIDLNSGAFAIQIANPNSGILSAILREKNGETIASGEISLNQFANTTSAKLEIAVRDNHNFSGTFYNFNKSPDLLMNEKFNSMKGQKADYFLTSLQSESFTDESGSFRVNKIAEKSVSLLRVRAKGFSETMVTAVAGQDKNIPLFPQSLAEALANTARQISRSDLPETKSIIWGQVLLDGKPLKGVKIRILHHEDIQPIYLAGWLPDPNSLTTNGNGSFFFANVPIGMQTIIAEKDGQIVGHSNMEIDENTTTAVVVESTLKSHQTQVKIFDIFTGNPVEALIQLQSISDLQQISGQTELPIGKINRVSFGYVQNTDTEYIPTQFTYFDSDSFIHIPMMKKDTLLQFAIRSRINQRPDTGIVIGVVPEDDFEVYIPHELQYEKSNVVYFDGVGNIVEKGKIGGGFILFNLPPKTQSVVVVSNKTNILSSKIIPVEPNTTSVLKFHF